MKPWHAILFASIAVLVGCGSRPTSDARFSPRPPEDLTIAVTVIAPEGSSPEPARFVIEPGGQLRAAVGAGSTPETFPPKTRLLTDAQVSQLYGILAREGLALPANAASRDTPRIEVTVIAGDTRRTGRHALDDPEARLVVDRCQSLARLGD
ncbi:MAG: hypothetical protein AAFY46_04770 [Planctomycetota bacterium]